MQVRKNITGAELTRLHGEDAGKIWREILEIGGYGDLPFDTPGGLDISGLSDSKETRVRKLIDGEQAGATTTTKKESK